MVYKPDNWLINSNRGADNGGYLLSPLTNMSYRGFLDSRSSRVHDHRLSLKRLDHINKLQNVQFCVHAEMIDFYNTFKTTLTENNIVLLSDDWLNVTSEMYQKVLMKFSGSVKPRMVGELVNKEINSKRNQTLRTQETFKIAKLYTGKAIYWPAVQD